MFRQAEFTLIHTPFLSTLDTPNLCSGYAEMLKHGLLSDDDTWAALLNYDLGAPDLDLLSRMVADSVTVKERIVMADPLERGIRKALNLGHTIGHAIESWQLSQGRPILHGYAVAYGLVAELYLSSVLCGFPTAKLHATARFIREVYGTPAIECKAYPTLLQLMRHDKKNHQFHPPLRRRPGAHQPVGHRHRHPRRPRLPPLLTPKLRIHLILGIKTTDSSD